MIIAITGLIGVGKTTTTRFFPLSWKRISADSLGHALLLEPFIVKRLTATFGNDIVTKRKINRALLAQRAFSSTKNLKRLNAIVHPLLRKKIIHKIKNIKKNKKNAILDCALLQELGLETLVDFTILVTAPHALRARRATQWSKKEITERVQFQRVLQHPDFIIANTGSKCDLKNAVLKIVTALEHFTQQ